MPSCEVEVSALSVSYGAVAALKNVSLRAAAGEFVALVGPSGCGKTTLLRCLAGFIEPRSGTICFGDEMVSAPGNVLPPERRGVGLVFQNYALWPHMTAIENVAYPLKLRGIGRHERWQQAHDLLAQVNLKGLEERRPSQLSGGQQQRVALARAFACGPRLLLLDEPLSNVDASLREELQELISLATRRDNVTAILATHDQEEALALADRVAVMRDGELLQIDSPVEIYQRPADGFVARFLGANNVFEVEILERRADSVVVRLGGVIIPLHTGAPAGDRALLSVRPAQTVLSSGQGAGIPGTISRRTLRNGQYEYRVATASIELKVWEQGLPLRSVGEVVSVRFEAPMLLPEDSRST